MTCTSAAAQTLTIGNPRSSQRRLRVIEGGRGQERRQEQQARLARTHLVIFALCVAMTFTLGAVWRAVDVACAQRVAEALAAQETQHVVVMPGETLWQIAEDHAVEGCTTGQLVQYLRSSNNLSDAALEVGMVLTVPCAAA